jgi:hypothetical protein
VSSPAHLDEAVDCIICLGERTAEPEQDGDTRFFACTECGSTFGFQLAQAQAESSCQLGISEDVRRAASFVPEGSPATFLGSIGRRPQ